MKLLKDYTGRELEDLADDEVQRLVDLECADAGVAFLPDHPGAFAAAAPKTDAVMYKVGNTGLFTSTREAAESIIDLLRGFAFVTLGARWNRDYSRSIPTLGFLELDTEVGRMEVYSEKRAAELKDDVARENERKIDHKNALEEFDKVSNSRQNVSDAVWKMIGEARAFKAKRESLVADLARYISLADGSNEIGLRFFQKAHPAYEEFLNFKINCRPSNSANAAGSDLRLKWFSNPENPEVRLLDKVMGLVENF